MKSATPAMMFNQGGCSFGHSLIRFSQDSEGSLVNVARTDAVDGELDRLITRRHDARVSFARTLGVEQSGLISRLDTLATRKRKA